MEYEKAKALCNKYLDEYFEKVKDKATHNKYNDDFEEYLKSKGYDFDDYINALFGMLEWEYTKRRKKNYGH